MTVRRALRSVAWTVCLTVVVASCVPPGGPGEGPEARPSTSAEAAKPEPPPAKPDATYLFSPQQRRNFDASETAEFTVVICAAKDLPPTVVAATLRDREDTAWTTTDTLGALPAGRHAVTYGIDVGQFPAGDYRLTVEVAGKPAGQLDLRFVPSVPQTHFRIGAWIEKPPRDERDAARWARGLGLNTVLLSSRSPWGANAVADGKVAEAFKRLRATPKAQPLELESGPPPFTRVADLLTGEGLRWVNACAVSGGGQPRLQPDRSFADEAVVRGAVQRIHHRLVAERAFARCAGIHFTDEATLAWHRAATYEGPFGAPARLQAFQAATGAKGVPWQQGAKWEGWQPFMAWRAGVVGRALGTWAEAAAALDPNLVATSQLYWPPRLGEGMYPPLTGQGLPALTVQAGLDGPAGMMMPAVATDLARMGNWGKPLWFMPELADDAELDEARAAFSLALARKVDGIVLPPTLDYYLDRPAAGPFPLQLVEGLGGLGAPLVPMGDLLLALEKPRDDVAILYSITEHAARIGKNPAEDPRATRYPWTLITAYEACMFAHFAPTFLSEEELLAGEGERSKVVLVISLTTARPEVKAKLEELAATGTPVLKSLDTEVTIEGSQELPIRFADLHAYHDELWRKGEQENVDTTLERRDEVAQAQLIYPDLARLRKKLKEFIERDYTVSDKTVVICDQRAGAARYLFVVNNEQRTDIFRGLKWELRASKTRVTLRPPENGSYWAYDVLAKNKRIHLPYIDGYPVIDLTLPAGGMKCIALLPQPIRGVYMAEAELRDGAIHIKANVHSAGVKERKKRRYLRIPTNAAIPLEIVIRDGEDNVLHRLYRVHTPQGYEDTIPVPALAKAGNWTVEVREMFSGETAKAVIEVEPPKAITWMWRRGPVAAFDGARIAALLASDQPLLIVVGTPEEAKKAEPLAQALGRPGRTCEIKLAADVAKPRALDAKTAPVYLSAAPDNKAMPDIRQPAILLGDLATHPLLQAVHHYGLLPRSVSPDHPGPGGALLCWQVSAFEPGVETVAAVAADAAGVDRAIAALLAAAAAQPVRTSWSPLAGEWPVPDDRIKPTIKELRTVWRKPVLDNPVDAVLPPNGDAVAVALLHGQAAAYDVIGKAVWHHWCTSRCRAVATNFDGSWTAYGSFPEIGFLTARGHLQWAVPLEETSLRADHTALAMSLRGDLTVAGTRRGLVRAFEMEGRQVFAIGDADADEATEGFQSRFGTINAIAITPKTDLVVVAGERELAAFDIQGQQVWAVKELPRVITLAVSLTEEPLFAVGTRDGTIAVLDKQGQIVSRAAAEGYVTSVCFRGQTPGVLAACLDGTLTSYDEKGKVIWRQRSPVGFRHVASALDGNLVAGAELSGRVILIDSTGDVVGRTPSVPGVIRVMALSPDGGYVFIGTSANELMLFKYARPKPDEDVL